MKDLATWLELFLMRQLRYLRWKIIKDDFILFPLSPVWITSINLSVRKTLAF
jgi:hypothetical protein